MSRAIVRVTSCRSFLSYGNQFHVPELDIGSQGKFNAAPRTDASGRLARVPNPECFTFSHSSSNKTLNHTSYSTHFWLKVLMRCNWSLECVATADNTTLYEMICQCIDLYFHRCPEAVFIPAPGTLPFFYIEEIYDVLPYVERYSMAC